MRTLALSLWAVSCFAADQSILNHLLESVESRYNSAKTLQVSFEETYRGAGSGNRTESGELYLRKPGRMRWDYKSPAGKIFLSDGKQVYFYNPVTNRAEKTKMKETEDLRAPLAFLLGKLDFDKDFTNFQIKYEGKLAAVTAVPKSDRLPYKEVEFTVDPINGYAIRRLVVTGQDSALLTFAFTNEVMNPSLNDKLFQFRLPPGAHWVDLTQQEGGR